ncbi:hypothetical protein TWF694_007824 [Orbilia ellipsospora]|uniref:LAGLIDADG endonuclease n=1 Tax=Orbilia ellipsospora TaxID=2528407 RepID=A0AAV9XKD5_9PEZI
MQKRILATVKTAVQDIDTVRARFTPKEPKSKNNNLAKVLRQEKFALVGDAQNTLYTIENLPKWITKYIEFVLIRATVPPSVFDLKNDKRYHHLRTGQARNEDDADWKLYPEQMHSILGPKVHGIYYPN